MKEYKEKLLKTVFAFLKSLDHQIDKCNEITKMLGIQPLVMPSKEICFREAQWVAQHLSKHVKEYGVVQKEIDFFKVSAWLGMRLWHESGKSFPLLAVVSILNLELRKSGRILDNAQLKKIASMAGNDGCKDELAIGMNGLYMVFRSCYRLNFITKTNP